MNRVEIPPAQERSERFSFIEYDNPDDAEEAYRKMHEKRLRCGVIRVEVQNNSILRWLICV